MYHYLNHNSVFIKFTDCIYQIFENVLPDASERPASVVRVCMSENINNLSTNDFEETQKSMVFGSAEK